MPSRSKSPKDPRKLVQSGIFAMKKKKWGKARRKFEEALLYEDMQENMGIWANLGVVFTNLKLLPEAKQAFNKSIRIDKKNSEVWFKKGIVDFYLGDYDDAEQSFGHARNLDKNNAEIMIFLSRTLRKKGLLKKSIKILENAQNKMPQSSKIPIELASIWIQEKNPEKAKEILENSIDSTLSPDPGLLLGEMLLDEKKFDKAIEIYQKIIDKFSNSYHAQYGLAIAYHAKKEWKTALNEYQKTLPLFYPKKPPQSLFINLARVLKNLNRKKEAIDYLYQAKKYGKTTLEILLLLSELFLEIDRPDRARRTLEDTISLDKNNPAIRFYLGMTMLQLKDINRARQYFQESLQLDSDFAESKLQLALLAIKENKLNEAFNLAYDVAIKNPEHLPANRIAAKLAFDLHKFKITAELLQPIVQNNPKESIEDLELLLRAWLLLSQPEKAKTFFENFIKENKDLTNKLKTKSFFSQFI